MAHFVITDETVHAAFETLKNNLGSGAAAKSMRHIREDEKKRAKARAFLAATGTVAEREAKAILSSDYVEKCKAEAEAIELDERFRAERQLAQAIIEAWRSCEASNRVLNKVG